MGVVVEEEPQSLSFSEWNAEKVKEDSELQPCFPPHLCLQFAFLSHTHLGLVVKAWIGAAPWDIGPLPLNNKNQLSLCDSEGNLSFEGLENHANGKEFCELARVGMLTEVLDHRIRKEEKMRAD